MASRSQVTRLGAQGRMSLPPSYTRFMLEASIAGFRDALERDPDGWMAPRLRRALERAEADLSEIKQMTGESNERHDSVDGRRTRRTGPHVARGFERHPNRKGFRHRA